MEFKPKTERDKALAEKVYSAYEKAQDAVDKAKTAEEQMEALEKRDTLSEVIFDLCRLPKRIINAGIMLMKAKLKVFPLLRAALSYAKKAWPVFPIGQDKIPHIKDWPNKASTDPKQIKKWWPESSKANIAIVCGERSGLVVIDVDSKTLPPELTRLARSMTAQVETPNGRHYYFKAPDEPLRTRQFDNFEVKAKGSNVTAPPSLHKSGKRYRWTRKTEPKLMPDWLLELVQEKKPPIKLKLGSIIPEGKRHNTLASMAGRYRNSGLGYEHLLVLLRLDNKKCRPKETDKEVRRLARDYSTKEMRREIVVINADDIPELELKWLCKNKFVCGGINIVVGYEDVGKTYIVVDIAYRVSVGAPWPDSSGKAPKGKVIICTNEAHMKGRIIKQLNVMDADMDSIKFFEMKADNQQFNFEQDLEQLKHLVNRLGNVRLIIFDPLLQYIVPSGKGTKTLQYADMNVALGLITNFLDTQGKDICIIGTNHITKGEAKDPRRVVDMMHGSTAFKAKASTIWCIIAVPKDEELRELVFGIGNVCTRPVYGKAFRLKKDFRVHWETGNIVEPVDTRLAEQRRQEKEPAKKELARKRILEILTKKNRKISAAHLAAKVCGDGEIKPHTYHNELTRLRKDEIIRSEKGNLGWWWWRA